MWDIFKTAKLPSWSSLFSELQCFLAAQLIGTKLVLAHNSCHNKMVIFDNIILIATAKPNKLQKIHNHVEKEDIISFLQIFVDFL